MNIQDTERLYFKKFSELTTIEKKVVVACWTNPFSRRYNNIDDPNETVEELALLKEPTFKDITDWWDTNFFRVAFLKENNEFVGTFRIGVWYEKHDPKIWNYGLMFINLKYWYKGFSSEIVAGLIKFLKGIGVEGLIAEASRENYGSYKTMIKNGFEFFGFDGPIDYAYKLDLTKPEKTKEEIEETWDTHMDMTIKDIGLEKVNRLKVINKEIQKMIERINNGENEEILVKEYFEKLNEIEEFQFD